MKRECQDCGLLYTGTHCPAHFDSEPQPAPSAEAAMPEGSRWKPCAAGFDDGRVLLVMLEAGLAIAVKRWKEPGVHMTEMSLDELRALLSRAGLAIVPANQPCSGCAAAREFMQSLVDDKTMGAGHMSDAIEAWLKEHPAPIDPAEASRRETGDW